MKKILFSLAIATISLASYKKANAQVSIQLNIGGILSAAISSAPMAINNGDDYYYYNDINCYYDIANNQYIYPDNGTWYYSAAIPEMYQNYDFRNARRLAINRRSFQGRGIKPIAFDRQPMMNNARFNNMIDRNNRMNQAQFAQQNNNRQLPMGDRQRTQMGHSNNSGWQMQPSSRPTASINNSRQMRENNRQNRF